MKEKLIKIINEYFDREISCVDEEINKIDCNAIESTKYIINLKNIIHILKESKGTYSTDLTKCNNDNETFRFIEKVLNRRDDSKLFTTFVLLAIKETFNSGDNELFSKFIRSISSFMDIEQLRKFLSYDIDLLESPSVILEMFLKNYGINNNIVLTIIKQNIDNDKSIIDIKTIIDIFIAQVYHLSINKNEIYNRLRQGIMDIQSNISTKDIISNYILVMRGMLNIGSGILSEYITRLILLCRNIKEFPYYKEILNSIPINDTNGHEHYIRNSMNLLYASCVISDNKGVLKQNLIRRRLDNRESFAMACVDTVHTFLLVFEYVKNDGTDGDHYRVNINNFGARGDYPMICLFDIANGIDMNKLYESIINVTDRVFKMSIMYYRGHDNKHYYAMYNIIRYMIQGLKTDNNEIKMLIDNDIENHPKYIINNPNIRIREEDKEYEKSMHKQTSGNCMWIAVLNMFRPLIHDVPNKVHFGTKLKEKSLLYFSQEIENVIVQNTTENKDNIHKKISIVNNELEIEYFIHRVIRKAQNQNNQQQVSYYDKINIL